MKYNTSQCPTLAKLPLPTPEKIGWPWAIESQQLTNLMPDGSLWPKISIVTPSYNQGQFIEETIRSVLLQGYPNLEYIIIDGGSTDASVEIIKNYEPWLAYWISEPDRGQGHAINKGIQQATGEILLWLNSDDLCLPNVFGMVAQIFRNNPGLSLVIGQALLIDAQGQCIGSLRSQFKTWEEVVTNPENSIRQISTFFSRRLFDELGLIEENLHIAMDTDLLIRFTRYNVPFMLDDNLTAFRTHASAKSSRNLVLAYVESDRVRKKYMPNDVLAASHRKRSAENWHRLSTHEELTTSERLTCLRYAIRHHPRRILSRFFLYSLKKLWIDNLNFTLGLGKSEHKTT